MQKIQFELAEAIDHVQGVLNNVARRCAEEGFRLDVSTCGEIGRPRFGVAATRVVYAAGDPIHEAESERR